MVGKGRCAGKCSYFEHCGSGGMVVSVFVFLFDTENPQHEMFGFGNRLDKLCSCHTKLLPVTGIYPYPIILF